VLAALGLLGLAAVWESADERPEAALPTADEGSILCLTESGRAPLPQALLEARSAVPSLTPAELGHLANEIAVTYRLHPKIDSTIYLFGGPQEVIVTVVDEVGRASRPARRGGVNRPLSLERNVASPGRAWHRLPAVAIHRPQQDGPPRSSSLSALADVAGPNRREFARPFWPSREGQLTS